jgi:sporulation protein YlmC with PRC-barrel domain
MPRPGRYEDRETWEEESRQRQRGREPGIEAWEQDPDFDRTAGYRSSASYRNREPERDYERSYREERESERDRVKTEREYGGDRYVGSRMPSEREWDVEGAYQGRGPRGYRRPSNRIREEVCERLTWDGQVDAKNIDVDVNQGVVILTGSVRDRMMKRRAEEVSERVPGVTDVENRLAIRQEGQEPVSYSRGQRPDLSTIRPGMKVMDRTGDFVGTVKEVRQNDFLVDRWLERDISVEFAAVERVTDRVFINPDVPERVTRMGDFPTV